MNAHGTGTVVRLADDHGDWLAVAVVMCVLFVLPVAFDGGWAGIALAVLAVPTALVAVSLVRDLRRMYQRRVGE